MLRLFPLILYHTEISYWFLFVFMFGQKSQFCPNNFNDDIITVFQIYDFIIDFDMFLYVRSAFVNLSLRLGFLSILFKSV